MLDSVSGSSDKRQSDPEQLKTGNTQFRNICFALLLNLPYILTLFALEYLPTFAKTFAIGAMIFITPGLPWAARRQSNAITLIFRVVLFSLIAALAVWLILLPWPGLTSRTGFILLLAFVTNAGLFLHWNRLSNIAAPFRSTAGVAILIVSALFYAQTYFGAAHLVPMLEDQDMETQGTAYGLMHEGEPTMVTNRNTTYFFAHPPLLHFWIGESALLSEDLDRLRYHHDTARLAQETGTRDPELLKQWERNYDQFKSDPVLMPTRTPNIFLSALTIMMICFLVLRLTGSSVAAIGAGLLYMTLPEIYVRSSYGGYLAVTNFLLVAGAYFYLEALELLPRDKNKSPEKRAGKLGFITAFLGGAADQKAILLPMAASAHAGLRILLDGALSMKGGLVAVIDRVRMRRDFTVACIIVFGFVAGWIAFAIYGLAIAPSDFFLDHIKGHIASRLKDPAGALEASVTQIGWYPSIAMLWYEFSDHTGWLVMGLTLIASMWAIPRVREAEGYFLLWALIGAVGFSLVDWRQTKHLAHILPAMVILSAMCWAQINGRFKSVVGAIAAIAILMNGWRVVTVMQDFTSIQPSPIW